MLTSFIKNYISQYISVFMLFVLSLLDKPKELGWFFCVIMPNDSALYQHIMFAKELYVPVCACVVLDVFS